MSKEEQSTLNTIVPIEHFPENTLEVWPLNSSPINIIDEFVIYRLPFKHNRGKPPNWYSLNHGERMLKYLIAYHVSTHILSQPLKDFVHKLSSDHVPNTVQEALNDPKCT